MIDFGELDGREYEAVQATCDDEPAAIGGETLRFVFISAPEGAYTVTIVNDDVDIADFIGAFLSSRYVHGVAAARGRMLSRRRVR